MDRPVFTTVYDSNLDEFFASFPERRGAKSNPGALQAIVILASMGLTGDEINHLVAEFSVCPTGEPKARLSVLAAVFYILGMPIDEIKQLWSRILQEPNYIKTVRDVAAMIYGSKEQNEETKGISKEEQETDSTSDDAYISDEDLQSALNDEEEELEEIETSDEETADEHGSMIDKAAISLIEERLSGRIDKAVDEIRASLRHEGNAVVRRLKGSPEEKKALKPSAKRGKSIEDRFYNILKNSSFSNEQIEEIEAGINAGLMVEDVISYTDPKIPARNMKIIRKSMLENKEEIL